MAATPETVAADGNTYYRRVKRITAPVLPEGETRIEEATAANRFRLMCRTGDRMLDGEIQATMRFVGEGFGTSVHGRTIVFRQGVPVGFKNAGSLAVSSQIINGTDLYESTIYAWVLCQDLG